MIIKPTENQEDIKDVLFHPDIYPLTADGVTIDKSTQLPTDDVLYIGGYLDKPYTDKMVALACIHPFKDGIKWHPYVLPAYRKIYGREFLRESLDMVKYTKVYVEIPLARKRLYNLAKKLGFKTIELGERRTMTL